MAGLAHIKLALGLHPLAVAAHYAELSDFIRMAPMVTHVGEIGLDFSKQGATTKERQLQAFRDIAKALSGSRKFISLHSRGAENVVLEVLQEFGIESAVFHWYTGPVEVLEKAIAQGCYFSVNPAMLKPAKGRSVIERIPRDRVLTESDGPYARIGNRAARPHDVSLVIEHLAKTWAESREEVIQQVCANYRRATTTKNLPPSK